MSQVSVPKSSVIQMDPTVEACRAAITGKTKGIRVIIAMTFAG